MQLQTAVPEDLQGERRSWHPHQGRGDRNNFEQHVREDPSDNCERVAARVPSRHCFSFNAFFPLRLEWLRVASQSSSSEDDLSQALLRVLAASVNASNMRARCASHCLRYATDRQRERERERNAKRQRQERTQTDSEKTTYSNCNRTLLAHIRNMRNNLRYVIPISPNFKPGCFIHLPGLSSGFTP